MCRPSSAGATRAAPPSTLDKSSARASVGALLAALTLAAGCTTTRDPILDRAPAAVTTPFLLSHERLNPATVATAPGPLTAEDNWFLALYTALHSMEFEPLRVELPAADPAGDPAIAHLVLPTSDRPQPVVIVLPILGGDHFVSEAFAKALVNRGIATARLERRPLELRSADSPEAVQQRFADAVRDARRLLDWLETRPEVDSDRLGVAGISVGSLMACLLHANDPRISASVLVLSGGGLPKLLYESRERDVRRFRKRMVQKYSLDSYDEFHAWVEPYVESVDPSYFAPSLEPDRVLLISGRFDRIISPARSRELWAALGQPDWVKLPTGHHSAIPFLWYVAGRAADHFERAFEQVAVPAAE